MSRRKMKRNNLRAFDTGLAAAVAGLTTEDDLLKRSKDSVAMVPYWDKTDDIVTGQDAIRARGKTYLPRFVDEEDSDFENRLVNTKFTNVYRDIVESLAAKPFEEEISLVADKEKSIPEQIEQFIEDVDGSGNNLTVFGATTFFNGINSAIDWIFVDYPTVDPTQIRTQADVKQNNIRPFWSHVLGRNVLEAKTKIIGGKETLIYMRILEPGMSSPDCVRVFKRDDMGVTWELWEKFTDPTNARIRFKQIGGGVISIGVIPLVPFYTGRRDGRSFKFFPAMKDAADLQIELYQEESGLKFARTMGAYSMLSGEGVKPQMMADGKTPKRIAVGPSKVLYGGVDGKGQAGIWKYISPDAGVLGFLKENIKDTTQELRELGKQPLTAQSGNLTVITTAVAAGKSKSAVAAWSLNLKNALENALVITCMWYGIKDETYDPEVRVYDDFDNFTDSDADIASLQSDVKENRISVLTYWEEMKRRRIYSAEFTAERETERLLSQLPSDEATEMEGEPKEDDRYRNSA